MPVDPRPLTRAECAVIGGLGVALSTGSGIDEDWHKVITKANTDNFLGALFHDPNMLWFEDDKKEVFQTHWATCPHAKKHGRNR